MMKTVILLPGLGLSKDVFNKLIAFLPKGNAYIPLNLPPYGEKYTFHNISKYLIDTLSQMHITYPIILIGYSYGGVSAAKFAKNYAEKISKLVLISTPFRNVNLRAPLKYVLSINLANKLFFSETLIKKLAYIWVKVDKYFNANSNVMAFITKGNLTSAMKCYKDILTYDLSPEAVSIKCPVLITYGTRDRELLEIGGNDLFSRFINGKVVAFDDNHMIPTNHPEQLAQEISRFIES